MEPVTVGELLLGVVHFTEAGGCPVVDREDGRVLLYNEYVLAVTAHRIPELWLNGEVSVVMVSACNKVTSFQYVQN